MEFRFGSLLYVVWMALGYGCLFISCSERDGDELSRSEQMQHSLLLVETTDKNMLSLLPCDSLLDEAIRYYDSGVNRAKALLYKERILARMKMNEEAMRCCFDALKELHGSNKAELKMEAMLCEDLGELYLRKSLFDSAVGMFERAKACYAGCGYLPGISSVNCNMGGLYLLQGDSAKARICIKKSIIPIHSKRDSVSMSVVCHNLSSTYEDLDSVLFYAKQALNLDRNSAMKSAILVGYAYLNKQQEDSARHYFQLALADTDIETKALAYNGLKDLMETQGEYKQALDYFSDYSVLMDSIYFYRESSELERKSYEYMADFKFYKDRIKIKAWSIGICLAVVLLFLCIILRVFYLRRLRRLQYERNEATLQAAISELQYHMATLRRQHEKDKESLTRQQLEFREISDEKAKLRNAVFMETQIYKRIKALSLQKKGKKKTDIQVLHSEEQTQLRIAIKEIYKDYILSLKQNCPQYTEDDCIFACLSLLGLDDFVLALCFGNFDTRIVVQRRYRMKKKAEESIRK